MKPQILLQYKEAYNSQLLIGSFLGGLAWTPILWIFRGLASTLKSKGFSEDDSFRLGNYSLLFFSIISPVLLLAASLLIPSWAYLFVASSFSFVTTELGFFTLMFFTLVVAGYTTEFNLERVFWVKMLTVYLLSFFLSFSCWAGHLLGFASQFAIVNFSIVTFLCICNLYMQGKIILQRKR